MPNQPEITWYGTTRHGTARHNTTRHGTTQHNMTQHGTTRHGTTQRDTTRYGSTYKTALTSVIPNTEPLLILAPRNMRKSVGNSK